MSWEDFNFYTPHLYVPKLSSSNIDLRKFAFLIECRSDAAAQLLQCNQRWIQPDYENLVDTYHPPEEEDAQRATPAVDDQPSAWLFPLWQDNQPCWDCGTYKADITFPRLRRVSKRHFVMYLNEESTWMVQNYSSFGMWLNGIRLEKAIGEYSRGALNPDIPNVIIAGMLEIIIYPVHHTVTPSAQGRFVPDLPEPNMELASQASLASTVGTSESTLQPLVPPTESYYYLENRRVPVQGQLRVCMAVHKRTGHRRIAKMYDQIAEERAGMQYQMMHTLKSSCNILSYDEYIDTEDIVKIITPYLMGAELLANIQDSSIELGFLVFKQIACALETLEKHGVVHHDVSEHTILLDRVSGRYKAYLTGFSEFKIEKGPTASFRNDLSCLASTVKRTLPTYDGRLCCEPTFRSLLSRSIQKDISASQACLLVEGIVAGFTECPFKTLWVTKKMSIKRIVDENDTEGLRLLDFLRIVLHCNPQDDSAIENSIRKVIRRERLFQLGTETYCYLEDAERLLHNIKSRHLSSLILDLRPPRHPEACWYETKHNIQLPVSYHEPSQMVNVSQVLNLSNDEEARSCIENISPVVQELRGSRQWEGYYIDVESMKQVFGRLGLQTGGVLGESPVSPCIFYDNDSNRFGIVATQEMIGFLFINRDGKTVNWSGREQTIDDAIEVCTDHGLHIAQRAIREGIKVEPEWTSRYNSEQIMSLFDGQSQWEEATEHNSFTYSTSLQFAFKRKAPESVPTLPLPRGHLVEQTGREICEAWLEVSDSIRPAKFTRTTSCPRHSKRCPPGGGRER